MSDQFRTTRDEPPPLGALLRALGFLGLAQVLRVVDVLVLLASPSVLRAHLGAGRRGFFRSPHLADEFARVDAARRAHQSLVELTYGETPVIVARTLLARAGVGRGSIVVDLGCGRGRVLLAARALGASARGVDLMRAHVEVIREPYADAGIRVIEGDATTTDLADATHVFVTWTCMSAATRARLQANLRTLGRGARVIAVTHELDDDESFTHVGTSRALFTWGIATVHIHERR